MKQPLDLSIKHNARRFYELLLSLPAEELTRQIGNALKEKEFTICDVYGDPCLIKVEEFEAFKIDDVVPFEISDEKALLQVNALFWVNGEYTASDEYVEEVSEMTCVSCEVSVAISPKSYLCAGVYKVKVLPVQPQTDWDCPVLLKLPEETAAEE